MKRPASPQIHDRARCRRGGGNPRENARHALCARPVITDYHAKYYAHLLRRRSPSDSLEKLGSSLLNATVDLNPHQIDAAFFAFRSPLSHGALLADEVGLG